MTIREILRRESGKHVGYMPVGVSKTSYDPSDCGSNPMQRVPRKITAYFHRSMISQVFKLGIKNVADDYIIKATDGTLFHVDY